jgi:hypothetical protein
MRARINRGRTRGRVSDAAELTIDGNARGVIAVPAP